MILAEIIQNEVNKGLARLDAELLMVKVLNISREKLFLEMETEISFFTRPDLLGKFKKMAKKRLRGVPLAYLTGVKEFYGLEFQVSDGCLIPRPETELLVELVLDFIKRGKSKYCRWKIADVGTGSGCIAIAIAKNAANVVVHALDNFEKALKIARKNVRRHFLCAKNFHSPAISSHVQLVHSDLLSALTEPVDVIVANLPYISDTEQLDRSVLFEPKSALIADQNGLGLYQRLFEQISFFPWSPQAIFLEIGFGQANGSLALVKKYFDDAETRVYNDLAGIPRAIGIFIKRKTALAKSYL